MSKSPSQTNPQAIAKERAKRLKRLRNMANLTRLEMCDDGCINPNTYKGWEIARFGGLSSKGAKLVLERIAREGVICSLDWLLEGRGTGAFIKPEETVEQYIQPARTADEQMQAIIDELACFKQHFPRAIYTQINDDGTSPVFMPGDFVAGIEQFGPMINHLIDETCLVRTEQNQLLVRTLRPGHKQGLYRLICTNPQTTLEHPVFNDIPLLSAAKIIRHYRLTAH